MPQTPPADAGARRSRLTRPERPEASTTRSASSRSPSTTMPVGRRPVGQRHLDGFGADLEEAVVRGGQLAAERVDDLAANGVRVVELHDALARPRAVGGWARVAVDEGHHGPAPCQRGTEEEAGR